MQRREARHDVRSPPRSPREAEAVLEARLFGADWSEPPPPHARRPLTAAQRLESARRDFAPFIGRPAVRMPVRAEREAHPGPSGSRSPTAVGEGEAGEDAGGDSPAPDSASCPGRLARLPSGRRPAATSVAIDPAVRPFLDAQTQAIAQSILADVHHGRVATNSARGTHAG